LVHGHVSCRAHDNVLCPGQASKVGAWTARRARRRGAEDGLLLLLFFSH
ncbi:unnamed protein product, partial [Ascophyllum nodosum]